MNNFGFGSPAVNGADLNVVSFKKAQNRVAVLMLMVTGISQYAGVLFLPYLMPGAVDPFTSELIQAVLYLSYMAMPVFLFGIVNGRGLKGYFSFKRGRRGTVAVGFAAMGVVYFAQLVGQLVALLLSSTGADLSALQPSNQTDVKTTVLRVIYIAVFAAVFEELVTRGIVLGELLPYGKSFAIVCSGVLFGLMHCTPVQLPFAFIVGVTLAWSVVRCGTLRVSMAVHFANNLISVIFTALPGYVSDKTALIIETCVSAVIFAAGSVAAVFLIRRDRDTEDKREYTALCTVNDEPLKVDLRDGLFRKISPLMYVYAALTVLLTLSVTFMLIFGPRINELLNRFAEQMLP